MQTFKDNGAGRAILSDEAEQPLDVHPPSLGLLGRVDRYMAEGKVVFQASSIPKVDRAHVGCQPLGKAVQVKAITLGGQAHVAGIEAVF
jgi:hypothetical protein